MNEGRSERAGLEGLRRRWEGEPTPQLSLQLAEEYRRHGRPAQAVEVLEKALESHPRHLAARVALARFRVELGELEGARGALEQVVEQDPTHLVANKLLVNVYLGLGVVRQARDRLDLYTLLNASDPEIERLRERVERGTAPPSEPPSEPASAAAPAPPGPPPQAPAEASEQPPERERTEPAAEPLPGGNGRPAAGGDKPFPGLWRGVGGTTYWRRLAEEAIFGWPVPAVVEPPAPPEAEPPEVEAIEPETFEPQTLEPQTLEPETRQPETPLPAAAPAPSGPTVTLARLYLEQGHRTEAEATLREVLERTPGDAEAERLLATLEAPAPPRPDAGGRLSAAELLAGAPPEALADPHRRRALLLERYRQRLRQARNEDV